MNEFLVEFGNRVRTARTSKRMSQREFAEEIGASLGSISFYEYGKVDPRMSLVKKMADVLDVSVAWLISGEVRIDVGTDPERAKKILEYMRFLDSHPQNTP